MSSPPDPPPSASPLTLVVIGDDERVHTALDASLGDTQSLQALGWSDVFDGADWTDAGRHLVEGRRNADVVLAEWDVDHAARLNNVGYVLRRHAQTPLLAVYVGTPGEEVAALAAGADGAVTPPVYPALVKARLRAYRRLIAQASPLSSSPDAESHDVRTVGPLRLDRTAHRVYVGDDEVALTAREFALLDYLVEHRGALRTRDQILDHVWDIRFETGTNMVDVYVHFLRRKLAPHRLDALLRTVRGRGYRFDLPDSEDPASSSS